MIQFRGIIFLLFLGLHSAEREKVDTSFELRRQWAPLILNCTDRSCPHGDFCSALSDWKKSASCLIKVTGHNYEVRGVSEGRGPDGLLMAAYIAKFLNAQLQGCLTQEVEEECYDAIENVCLEVRDNMVATFHHQIKKSGCSLALVCYNMYSCAGKIFHIGSTGVVKIDRKGQSVFSTIDDKNHTTNNVDEIRRLKVLMGASAVFTTAGGAEKSLLKGITEETRLFGMTDVYGKKSREISHLSSYSIKIDRGDMLLIGTGVLMKKVVLAATLFFARAAGGDFYHFQTEFPARELLDFACDVANSSLNPAIKFSEQDQGSLHVVTTT